MRSMTVLKELLRRPPKADTLSSFLEPQLAFSYFLVVLAGVLAERALLFGRPRLDSI